MECRWGEDGRAKPRDTGSSGQLELIARAELAEPINSPSSRPSPHPLRYHSSHKRCPQSVFENLQDAWLSLFHELR